MSNKLFVWDFHGVLEKNTEYAIREICEEVLDDFDYNKSVSLDEVKELYGRPWNEYYRELAPEAGKEEINDMIERSHEIGKEIVLKYIEPREHAHEVLKKVKGAGNSNIVLTNSTEPAANFFLKELNLKDLVEDWFALDSGKCESIKSKHRVLKDYLRNSDYQDVIVVGDNEEDIRAGIRCGAKTYLFTEEEGVTEAHEVISDLREVLDEINAA